MHVDTPSLYPPHPHPPHPHTPHPTHSAEGSGDTTHWIFKNKEYGKTSATASLGMLFQWDVEGGLTQIDKYMYSSDNHVVAGAYLAIGILTTGVRDEADPAFALLEEHVHKEDPVIRSAAIMALGLAYAGTAKVWVCFGV